MAETAKPRLINMEVNGSPYPAPMSIMVALDEKLLAHFLTRFCPEFDLTAMNFSANASYPFDRSSDNLEFLAVKPFGD